MCFTGTRRKIIITCTKTMFLVWRNGIRMSIRNPRLNDNRLYSSSSKRVTFFWQSLHCASCIAQSRSDSSAIAAMRLSSESCVLRNHRDRYLIRKTMKMICGCRWRRGLIQQLLDELLAMSWHDDVVLIYNNGK